MDRTIVIPGPRTRELARRLQQCESQNVTFVGERFPVFWERASGSTVTDVDGNDYVDLTAAFGVANAGHGNAAVANAIAKQAGQLMHAMGDVHPTEIKVTLLERLSSLTPVRNAKVFLASTGAEAVEAAMKTAMIATGKRAFAAYRGAYHGLSFGTLAVSGIERFRTPFAALLPHDTLLLGYPQDDCGAALQTLDEALASRPEIAALLIEPLQARGGCLVPPEGYLRGVREICTSRGVLLIADEIYTGFGRTGAWFAFEHESVAPDIVCMGKAMANGFPISAIAARPGIMDAWPVSQGEALHTSTYLGNPMGCAAAVATIGEIERLHLPQRAQRLGATFGKTLQRLVRNGKAIAVRGRGLMWGIQLASAAQAERAVHEALQHRLVLLQAGPQGDVLSLTPPLVIDKAELLRAVDVIEELL